MVAVWWQIKNIVSCLKWYASLFGDGASCCCENDIQYGGEKSREELPAMQYYGSGYDSKLPKMVSVFASLLITLFGLHCYKMLMHIRKMRRVFQLREKQKQTTTQQKL
mmetsp:Transcript_15864/g.27059  ORF Transcript_15864/g.27059 Transcript_15864/m.27059 type:complete len:108 (+) Transcript_15864:249-572(+)